MKKGGERKFLHFVLARGTSRQKLTYIWALTFCATAIKRNKQTNKPTELMDLILGLPVISLYNKRNKKMFSSLVNGIFTVPGIPLF